MTKFTQEDFDNFPVDENGFKLCPSGDYSDIKVFGEGCNFGRGCSFSERCSFGKGCSFGEGCNFGRGCIFGEGCSFGSWCSFGDRCSFGEVCGFGDWCGFGELCSFGELCYFGEGCSFEDGRVKNGKYFACDRIGSDNRKTYFFADKNKEIFVRAGCFFGTEKEFIEQLEKTHGGTKHEKHYISALTLAKAVLLED